MVRRIKVKGIKVGLVRHHEAWTDRRVAAIDGALAKARDILDAAGDAVGSDEPDRPPLPPADQITLWKQAALLLFRLKAYRTPPPIGLDHVLTDDIIKQAADTLTEIVPPGVRDFDLRQVKGL